MSWMLTGYHLHRETSRTEANRDRACIKEVGQLALKVQKEH